MSAFRALRTLALASAFAVSAAMAQAAPVLATADNINAATITLRANLGFKR